MMFFSLFRIKISGFQCVKDECHFLFSYILIYTYLQVVTKKKIMKCHHISVILVISACSMHRCWESNWFSVLMWIWVNVWQKRAYIDIDKQYSSWNDKINIIFFDILPYPLCGQVSWHVYFLHLLSTKYLAPEVKK